VTIHESEKERFKDKIIIDNFLQPDKRGLCPFKNDNGLCNTHTDKPFGCRASPFTLTTKGTLIVRNRYRMLKCYNTKDAIPVYEAHKESLLAIIGSSGYEEFLNGKDYINIPNDVYKKLIDNDKYKKGLNKNELKGTLYNTTI